MLFLQEKQFFCFNGCCPLRYEQGNQCARELQFTIAVLLHVLFLLPNSLTSDENFNVQYVETQFNLSKIKRHNHFSIDRSLDY